MRFQVVTVQLWFEILNYLDHRKYFECMMTELNLSTDKEKYRNVSQFLAGCQKFLDLQQAVVNTSRGGYIR